MQARESKQTVGYMQTAIKRKPLKVQAVAVNTDYISKESI